MRLPRARRGKARREAGRLAWRGSGAPYLQLGVPVSKFEMATFETELELR